MAYANKNSKSNQMDWDDITNTTAMEWMSAQVTKDGTGLIPAKIIEHSTPFKSRPAPTASPNLSAIMTPIENEIMKTADRLARVKLD